MARYQKIAQINTSNSDLIAYIEKEYIVIAENPDDENCSTFHIVKDTAPPPEPEDKSILKRIFGS